MSMTLAKLIRIERSAARAYRRPNRRALFASREASDAGAGNSRPGHRKLVTMLLPERPAMTNAPMADGLS